MSDIYLVVEFLVWVSWICLVIFDVDGVLIDGKLYFFVDGSEFKIFNILDGYGIKMFIVFGVCIVIIIGCDILVVEWCVCNLGIQYFYQGWEDKFVVFDEFFGEFGLGYE